MALRRIFMAGLLGCTMLAGCNGSDDKADNTSQGTYAVKTDIDQLQADNAALRAQIAALQNGADANSKETRDLIIQLQTRLASQEKALKDREDADGKAKLAADTEAGSMKAELDALKKRMDAAEGNLTELGARIDGLGKRIDELDKTSLSAEEQKAVKGLDDRLTVLKNDFNAALKPKLEAAELTKLLADIETLKSGKLDKTSSDTLSKTVDEKLAALKTSVDGNRISSEDFKARIAALETDIYKLQNPRVDMALTQFVNAFVGTSMTETGGGHSGNLNPGAQTPFGMVSFGPDTSGSGQGWGRGSGGYYYGDDEIQFFSMTHLNGPGCRGQSTVAMMPMESDGAISSASYGHDNEKAEPGYYQVKFDNGINSEFTATTRTGMARFTFADKDKAFLTIDSSRNNSNKSGGVTPVKIEIAADKKSVSGQAIAPVFCDGTWNQPVYFHATFDKPLKSSSVADDAATLQFEVTDADKSVQLKVGISSVSTANAKLNLETENAGWSFDAIRQQSSDIWNGRLNTVQLDIAKPEEFNKLPQAKQADATNKLTQFYTALYRVYSGPTVFSDVNGDYRSMKQVNRNAPGHTLPERITENVATYKFKLDGKDAGYKTHYSGFSMWDTYRSQAQLVALIAPDEASEMMQSLVADAQQCGAFPHWVDGSEDTIPMQGDHALNVIAGSYLFGATKFDLETARKFVKQSTFDPASVCNDKLSVGRNATGKALPEYLQLGYISSDSPASWKHSSATVEMITSDRSAGAFLAGLPTKGADQGDIDKLFKRASNWTNIFDDDSKTLRAKDSNGNWESGDFHESGETNYIWAFGHDWTALIGKLGGKQAAIDRLNKLIVFKSFTGSENEPTGYNLNSAEHGNTLYIGNEPAFQTPWAYNWAGSPKHAQYIIPIIMRKNFSLNPGGLPGNDDMGATSSWYVLASLGLYPVIPSAPGMAISTPQFAGATLWLGNGKKLRIETDKQAMLDDVRYISQMKLGDAEYKGTWLPLDKIRNGGKLKLHAVRHADGVGCRTGPDTTIRPCRRLHQGDSKGRRVGCADHRRAQAGGHSGSQTRSGCHAGSQAGLRSRSKEAVPGHLTSH
jgi:putative alpha-1,2-mannosidase/outer membrane murein-binding lipoprotein Lpp